MTHNQTALPPRLVSVVIATFNARDTLGLQLDALAAQTYRGAWELVVADNGSTDGTVEFAQTWAARLPRVRVVDASERRGTAAAANAGARAAGGDVLLFCEHDDVVEPRWIEEMVHALARYDLVGGRLDHDTLNDARTLAWRPGRPQTEELAVTGFLPFSFAANFGVQRNVFWELGGWNEAFMRAHDVEFCWRAQLSSYRIGFAPNAVVRYRYRRTLGGLARQFYGYGTGAPHLYREYRDHGAPGRPFRHFARTWLRLLMRSPHAVRSADYRGQWIRMVAYRAGLLRGSLRHRVWFP